MQKNEFTQKPTIQFDPNSMARSAGENIQANPLSGYFRQPSIYLKLPSQGKFYPQGAVQMNEQGEVAIYPMTARDEITFKTPDALMNGEATKSVIKSCVPDIKDPGKLPIIDLDALLIAIRIASYGEKMSVQSACPVCKEVQSYQLSLPHELEAIGTPTVIDEIKLDNGLSIKLRPLNLDQVNRVQRKTFEEQKLFNTVLDSTLDEGEKLTRFQDSFLKITQITVDMMIDNIEAIITPTGTVTNIQHIAEFINNAEGKYFDAIQKAIGQFKQVGSAKPKMIHCETCEKAGKTTTEYETPLTFDASNFFESRS
jgi:hypothetical protein